MHKVERVDSKGQSFLTTATSLGDVWQQVVQHWGIKPDEYEFVLQDGTGLIDDGVYQKLKDEYAIYVRRKPGEMTRQRKLTNELVLYLAKEKLEMKDVRELGIKMSLQMARIKKYEDLNRDNQVESKGTAEMLLDWRKKLEKEGRKDQLGALVELLAKAGLNELAGDLDSGAVEAEMEAQ